MSDCEHGYVVRSAAGANRFLCKECNERFPTYPISESRAAAQKAYEEEAIQKEIAGYRENAKAMVGQIYGTGKK